MLTEVFDEANLMRVVVVYGHLDAAAFASAIAAARRASEIARRRPDTKLRLLTVVDSDDPMPALVRKEFAEATDAAPCWDIAHVTRSEIARSMMTAIAWLAPTNPRRRRKVFATYDEARTWLVEGGADGDRLDRLHARALEEAARNNRSSSTG